jgi:hypothetical protein
LLIFNCSPFRGQGVRTIENKNYDFSEGTK